MRPQVSKPTAVRPARDAAAAHDGLAMPAGRSWARQAVLDASTAALRPLMSRRARRLAAQSPEPRVHLGCAYTILPGWINVDLFGRVPADVALDVKKPLPFDDGSIDAIFTEHMVEHLTYEEAFALARECARVLRPGGVVRVVVPDFERYVRSYLGENDLIETNFPDRLTSLIGVASSAYGWAHRSIWDAETLVALLERARLCATGSRFGESLIRPCPDKRERQAESLYVEAVNESSADTDGVPSQTS